MKRLKTLIVLTILVFLILGGILKYNLNQIYPTQEEIALLKSTFKDIKV